MADAQSLRDALAKKVREAIEANHAKMDKGLEHEHYLKLVGRNDQLREFSDWMSKAIKDLGVEFDDDV